jgi:XTP/dITP diphosphohydrolase
VLEGVPVSLPALVKSIRVQEKARAAGFDWDEKEQVWEKVKEELEEFKREEEAGDQQKMEQEFGDVMFALVNYARFRNINPEEALEKTNKKFIRRFRYMEDRVNEDGKKLSEMDLPEMDKYWDEAKSKGL